DADTATDLYDAADAERAGED
ncbi:transcriptional regulator, partial [Xanthomonas perforans]